MTQQNHQASVARSRGFRVAVVALDGVLRAIGDDRDEPGIVGIVVRPMDFEYVTRDRVGSGRYVV